MTANTVTVRIGTIGTDAKLSKIEAGHGSSLSEIKNETSGIEPTTQIEATSDSSTTSDYALKLTTVHPKTTITYGVGEEANTAHTASRTGEGPSSYVDITGIQLNSSGTTTIKIKATAEDGENTAEYTITVKSSYARLSGLTVTATSPTPSVTGLGLQGAFSSETEAYDVKIAHDSLTATVTPTILAGYGTTGVTVTASNCSADGSVDSGSALTVSSITDNATLKLKVTAADGNTSKEYTLTFKVENVDVGITTLNVTSQNPSQTVQNDEAKKGAADYYFMLPESDTPKGKLNVTLSGAGASWTLKKQGGSPVANKEDFLEPATYILTVTSAHGNTKDYTVIIAKELKLGKLDPFQYSVNDESGYTNVVGDSDTQYTHVSDTEEKYVMTKTINPADYSKTSIPFYLQGTPSRDASVTQSGSGLTSAGQNKWSITLTHKATATFKITASTDAGKTVYEFNITVAEKKNGITSVRLYNDGTSVDETVTITSAVSYEVNVPYACSQVNISAVTEGYYAIVEAKCSGGAAGTVSFNTTAPSQDHTGRTTISLNDKQDNIIKIYAYSDANTASANKGTEYTITVKRQAANKDNKLSSLSFTFDSESISLFEEGAFDPEKTDYTYKATYKHTYTGAQVVTVLISAIPQNSSAQLKINSVAATSGEQKSLTYTFKQDKNPHTEEYTITVTPEDATAVRTYKITVQWDVPEPEFTEYEISTDGSYYQSVSSSFTGTATNKTYTVEYDINTVAVGSKFYIKPTVNDGATIDTPASDLTKKADYYEATLKFGIEANVYSLTARTVSGTVTYVIKVTLYEDIDEITDIGLVGNTSGTSADYEIPDYSFNGQTTIDVEVPYTVATVTITVSTDGEYTYIFEKSSSSIKDSQLTKKTKTVTLKGGETTTVVIYASANKGSGMHDDLGNHGQEYTINITKQKADADVTLDTLQIKIDGEELQFRFDPNITSYDLQLPYTGTKTSLPVEITATPTRDTSKVTGNVGKQSNFTVSTTSENKVEYKITVTAQDPNTPPNIYTITVKQVIPEGDFIQLQYAAPKGSFEDVLTSSDYDGVDTFSVEYIVSSTIKVGDAIRIKAIGTYGATLTVSSDTANKPSLSAGVYTIKLAEGLNTFTVQSESINGGKTVYIVVNLIVPSSDADLKSLSLKVNGQEYVVNFNPDTTEYEIEIPANLANKSATIAAQAKDSAATVTGTGTKTLAFGSGDTLTFPVTVTAEDGTQKTYNLNLIKTQVVVAGNATIDIDGKSFEFDPETGEPIVYRMPLYEYSKDEIEIRVDVPGDGTYDIIRVYEENKSSSEFTSVSSGTRKTVSLYYGSNVFQINVNLPDGTVKKLAVVTERDKPYFTSLSSAEIADLRRDYTGTKDTYTYTVSSSTDKLTLDWDYDKSLFDSDIKSSYDLQYGANEIQIMLYDKGNTRSSDVVRTITLNVFREQEGGADNTFWFIMFWILIALSMALLVIIFLVRSRKSASDEPEVIYAPAAGGNAGVQPAQQQPTIIIQNSDDEY